MKDKTINAARLLAFMFLYPNHATLFSVEAKDFWDFVLAETGSTPADLDAFLDGIFPEDEPVRERAAEYLKNTIGGHLRKT
jgi:hypothetical protein